MSYKHYTIAISLLGLLPCILSAPLWIMGFFFSIGITAEALVMGLLFWLWSCGGAAGLTFFIRAIRAKRHNRLWLKKDYFLASWGAMGIIPFLYLTIDDAMRSLNYQYQTYNTIIMEAALRSLVLSIPLIGLAIAYIYRPKPQPNEHPHGK